VSHPDTECTGRTLQQTFTWSSKSTREQQSFLRCSQFALRTAAQRISHLLQLPCLGRAYAMQMHDPHQHVLPRGKNCARSCTADFRVSRSMSSLLWLPLIGLELERSFRPPGDCVHSHPTPKPRTEQPPWLRRLRPLGADGGLQCQGLGRRAVS